MSHVNINSLRNKFEMLNGSLKAIFRYQQAINIWNLIVDYNVFPTSHRRSRDKNGAGILLYVREDIPSTYHSKIMILTSNNFSLKLI